MKIGINLRPLYPGKIGGLEHHFRGVFEALLKLDSRNEYILYVHDENRAAFEGLRPRVRLHQLPDGQHLAHLAAAVRDSDPDAVFHPFLFIEPLHLDALNAVLIPDVRYAHFPEQIPPGVLASWREQFPATARRADLIFTLSEDSKRDVCASLGAAPDRVRITSPAVDPIFFAETTPARLAELRTRLGLPERFLFYPADTWPHKNHERLLGALRRLRAEGYEIPLVLSGFPNAGEAAVRRAISRNRLDDLVHRLGYVERADLPALYRLATALVFPSMYEGWGMPVSEAMAAGIPVACSRAASIPEVGGDAALYFDPYDEASIAAAIKALWSDKALRRQLAGRGHAQARACTWEKAARTTLDGLLEIARPRLEACDPLPLISIVTPSYNQGRFIGRTIESVLSQDYPHVEYLVLDGGSTDETVGILRGYGERLRWISRRDRGQSDAINQGLKAARGEILAYLNSDDTYAPGALSRVAAHMVAHPGCDLVYGQGRHIDADDRVIEDYPTEPFDAARLATRSFICQPTAFWRRRLHAKIGWFDEDVHFVMDYEFWMRAAKVARITMLEDQLANSRLWEENKTLGSRDKHLYQALEVVHRHYGRVPSHWLHAYTEFRLGGGAPSSAARSALAVRMRRWRRQWLLTRLDVRFNGWRALAEGALDQAAEPREGYDDGWMGARMIRRLAAAGEGHRVVVGGELPAWPASARPPRLRVYAERRLIGEFRPPAIGAFRLAFALPRELAARSELEIALRASSTFVPSRHGLSTDDRRLSCVIRELALEG